MLFYLFLTIPPPLPYSKKESKYDVGSTTVYIKLEIQHQSGPFCCYHLSLYVVTGAFPCCNESIFIRVTKPYIRQNNNYKPIKHTRTSLSILQTQSPFSMVTRPRARATIHLQTKIFNLYMIFSLSSHC